MNERRVREVLAAIEEVRNSLQTIDKIGLSVSDRDEQTQIWRITLRAHEAMRQLSELASPQHPEAELPYAPFREAKRDFAVRPLGADDLKAYRELHRYGLREAPLAFVETPADDEARPDDIVAAMLARGEAWGAFDGDRLVGKLVIDALPYTCLSHTQWLHAVYLHPDARGTGAGEALMFAALADAKSRGAQRIALWVNERNAAALQFYGRCGFRRTGRIPGGIQVGAALVDDVLMCLSVAP